METAGEAPPKGASKGSLADRPKSSVLGRLTKPVRELRGPTGGLRPSPRSPVPGYGLEPVGNGHAAAGFSACALELSAVDGAGTSGVLAIVSAGLAVLAALLAFFFFPAFFFFLAAFFLP